MKLALVLSGGGAKGAFEVGVLKYLEEVVRPQVPNLHYDIIAGVSVGCLNGGMMAQNKFKEMVSLWESINNSSIYTGNNFFGWLYNSLFRKSVLSNTPLLQQIQDNFSISTFRTEFKFGVTSLISGKYRSLSPKDFTNEIDFQNAILASTAMPVIWPPVDFTLGSGEKIEQCVDGGLRNIAPLSDVLSEDPTHVIIINCSGHDIAPDSSATNNIFCIAQRSLTDIALNEIFDNDIDRFLQVNEIVRQASASGVTVHKSNGKPYVHFKNIIISPTIDLGDSLDFSQTSIAVRMNHGEVMARQLFELQSGFFTE